MILLQYYEKKVMLMKLINSKNILDCDEIEEVHTQEKNDMNDADFEVTIKPYSLHDCFEMVEYVDAKQRSRYF